MNKQKIINMFTTKEAFSSVAIDNQPDSLKTMQLGLLSNFKLYHINVKIKNKHTDQIVWQGPIAHVANYFGRL